MSNKRQPARGRRAADTFTAAGSLTLTDRLTAWNGSTFLHLDANLPGAATAYGLLTGPSDPIISSNYDLWLGFNTTGVGHFSGLVTASNVGTAGAHPVITFKRTGGSAATVEWLKNETAGTTIWPNYALLDGESLELDMRPMYQKITSSFFGPVPDAVLIPSPMSQFTLQRGDNNLTAFVNFDVASYPNEITAWAIWHPAFSSLD